MPLAQRLHELFRLAGMELCDSVGDLTDLLYLLIGVEICGLAHLDGVFAAIDKRLHLERALACNIEYGLLNITARLL